MLRATSPVLSFLPHHTPCPTPPPSPTTPATPTPATTTTVPTTTVTTTAAMTATPICNAAAAAAEVFTPATGRRAGTGTATRGATGVTRAMTTTAPGNEGPGKCRRIPLAVTHRYSHPCSSGTPAVDPNNAEGTPLAPERARLPRRAEQRGNGHGAGPPRYGWPYPHPLAVAHPHLGSSHGNSDDDDDVHIQPCPLTFKSPAVGCHVTTATRPVPCQHPNPDRDLGDDRETDDVDTASPPH